jgi:hypothetical protein
MKRKFEDHELFEPTKKLKMDKEITHKYCKFLQGWKIDENESTLWKMEIFKELKPCVEKKQYEHLYFIFHSIQKYFLLFIHFPDLLILNINLIQWN